MYDLCMHGRILSWISNNVLLGYHSFFSKFVAPCLSMSTKIESLSQRCIFVEKDEIFV
jgi:hypothetical protein